VAIGSSTSLVGARLQLAVSNGSTRWSFGGLDTRCRSVRRSDDGRLLRRGAGRHRRGL